MNSTDDWTTADLVACIQRDDPESAAQVLRALAARIDRDAASVADPRSLLHDLGCAFHSLTSAVDRIARTACADLLAGDATARDGLRATVARLSAAGRGVGEIADGWI